MYLNVRRTGFVAAFCLVAGPALSETIELTSGNMVLKAPANVNCEDPPDFELSGVGSDLFKADREPLNAMVAQMAAGLAGSCDGLNLVTVTGTENGIRFSFDVTRADGWRLDPREPTPEPQPEQVASVPATPAPAPPAAAENVAAPTPKPPQKPEVAPGLDFATYTSIFGSLPTVRGHVSFENNSIWARVMAARMYAHHPQILASDGNAIEVLRQMATEAEYAQVMGEFSGRGARQMSVFERRDIANRIRTQLKGGLDQRRQTGPIQVYHAVPVQLGEYDFNRQSFPLQNVDRVRQHRQVGWRNTNIQNAFGNVVLPTALNADADQARQLDAYLRGRNDTTLWFAVFAVIDPEVPRSLARQSNGLALATDTKVSQVALFVDRGLSQVLYDYTPDLASSQSDADIAATALTQTLSTGEDIIRAIDSLNGQTANAAAVVADLFATAYDDGSGQPPEERRAEALASIQAASADRMMRISGSLEFGSYDPVRKVMPLTRGLRLGNIPFTSLQGGVNIRMNLVPALQEIPMDPATAAKVEQAGRERGQLEFRLDAELIQGSHIGDRNSGVQIEASLRPETIQVFNAGRRYGANGPRTMLLDTKLPETTSAVPSLLEVLTPIE